MHDFDLLLAARGDDWGELAGVIALLIMGAVGGLVNWLKSRRSRAEDDEAELADELEEAMEPRRAEPVVRETRPVARRPAEPERRPPPRRVVREPVVTSLPIPEMLREQLARLAGAGLPAAPKPAPKPGREARPPRAVSAAPVSRPPRFVVPAALPRPAAALVGPLDAAELRRAIILSEILAPPVALREPPAF